ncbi:NAD-glutamate dehydrogenase domain-containing protein [Qipengyuania thermophila]|uniref:NAD-glutamate dehydrogenase domain-containing protein n=1 Tax=Qipengyuania thermophila TaxID=2509361 RepID=UPI001F3A11B6|nr:NAD-glutamate dehydrogenase domain-containing protein [Qipengyuania thermophila]
MADTQELQAPHTDRAAPDLRSLLIRRIEQLMLPGDTPFPQPKLGDAVAFLLEAAAQRRPRRAVVTVDSALDDRRFTRFAVINDDMPFLVDSIAAVIAAEGLSIDRLVHPVVAVRRDEGGQLRAIFPPGEAAEGSARESMVYIETVRMDARSRRRIASSIRTALEDVRAAVGDWTRMQRVMEEDAARLDDAESAALLRWLNAGMLTQLGHVTRRRDGTATARLGICRKSTPEPLTDASYERAFAWFDAAENAGSELLIIKANHLSFVHRRVPLDLFLVPERSGGVTTALSVHAGVWTSAALAAPAPQVPRLRRQLQALLDRLGIDATGHAGKALVHAFTALPHDLLIGFDDESTARVVTAMMTLMDRPRPRVVLVESSLARHLFAFVWLPRDLLSTQVRLRIQRLLEEGNEAALLNWSLEVEGGNLALLRFALDVRTSRTRVTEALLEERLQDMLRGWQEAVERELSRLEDASRAAVVAARLAEVFPIGYRIHYGAAEAAQDIARLRRLVPPGAAGDGDQRGVRLYRKEEDETGVLRLKLYQAEGTLALSDAVPVLENFGFHVQSEMPTLLDGGRAGAIHDFLLGTSAPELAARAMERAEVIEDAIAAVLNGHAENDGFYRLVVETTLDARAAGWLRALYHYLRQTGLTFTLDTVTGALLRAPQVTANIVRLFVALHDPAFAGSREAEAEEARAHIRQALVSVSAINDDRILRLFAALVESLLRTNAFAPSGQEALAFKIDPASLPALARPLPWREIWVYSRRVEGIHLRAGPVARGGLRWSDRRDDFRTEVLGLLKAQRVKNAVIVPTGAKGGFYPKQLPSPAIDRAGWAAEGQAAYEVFIRALLSITDNLSARKVIHPPEVVVRDGADPYFVVAADKGTARFSDVANAIALEKGFWLGDAFASGGSNGYDHKAMGITARGGWISVQRHFRELGVDVQSEPVRVAGCGDMSGDVFGNGMLLSRAVKLVAAFDHRHIFIDPDPDPETAWEERKRLFDLPSSSWADYDTSRLSRGGGVYRRDAKSITLSAEAMDMLGLPQAEIEPDALITAILKAKTDLFWFGGIGTYVKAAAENNAVVGDPGNDAVRVNGSELGARVVGEGANLALTQAGRIEFARAGGRINTDFIDNSAGVDCSDNEVNIKIALAAAMRAGTLTLEDRNALLAEMTDEVAELVLDDNRNQALALSIAEMGGRQAAEPYAHLIASLERLGALDRMSEGLPDADELSRRAVEGRGLERPELAVLLSTTKLLLQDQIEADDPVIAGPYEDILLNAFPRPMRERFGTELRQHRLRREIVATKLANRVINRLGILHPFELAEEEGVSLGQVAAAFVIVDRLMGLEELWARLETAEMTESARLLLLSRLGLAIRSEMADLLRTGRSLADPVQVLGELRQGVDALGVDTFDLLAPETRQHSNRILAELEDAGAPDALAREVAHLFDMDGAIGVADLAREIGVDTHETARMFITLGDRLGLDWAQSTASIMTPSDVWERLLVAGLARDFQQLRLDFLRRLARSKRRNATIEESMKAWLESRAVPISLFREMITRAQRDGVVTAPMLAQVASMARNLLCR